MIDDLDMSMGQFDPPLFAPDLQLTVDGLAGPTHQLPELRLRDLNSPWVAVVGFRFRKELGEAQQAFRQTGREAPKDIVLDELVGGADPVADHLQQMGIKGRFTVEKIKEFPPVDLEQLGLPDTPCVGCPQRAVEEGDLTKNIARFHDAEDDFLAAWNGSADADSTGQHAIKGIAGVAFQKEGFVVFQMAGHAETDKTLDHPCLHVAKQVMSRQQLPFINSWHHCPAEKAHVKDGDFEDKKDFLRVGTVVGG